MKLLLVVCLLVAVVVGSDPTPPDYGNYSNTYYTFQNLIRDESFGDTGSGSQNIDYVNQRARYDLNFISQGLELTIFAFFDKKIQYNVFTTNDVTSCYAEDIKDDMYPADFLQTKCHYSGEGEVMSHLVRRWACPARELNSLPDTYEIYYLYTDMNRLQNPRREVVYYLSKDGVDLGTFFLDILTFSKSKPTDNLWHIPPICDQAEKRDIFSVIPESTKKMVSSLTMSRP